MPQSVYLETTIPSYLTARPSRDLITAANQTLTKKWWRTRRIRFELFVSQIVIDEAKAGDSKASSRRLTVLHGLTHLDVTDECKALGKALIADTPIPPKAMTDALHVAIAAVHGIDFLFTWNCSHIANAALRPNIQRVCRAAGYNTPVICTPMELME